MTHLISLLDHSDCEEPCNFYDSSRRLANNLCSTRGMTLERSDLLLSSNLVSNSSRILESCASPSFGYDADSIESEDDFMEVGGCLT